LLGTIPCGLGNSGQIICGEPLGEAPVRVGADARSRRMQLVLQVSAGAIEGNWR
jgi:hypothetical protein